MSLAQSERVDRNVCNRRALVLSRGCPPDVARESGLGARGGATSKHGTQDAGNKQGQSVAAAAAPDAPAGLGLSAAPMPIRRLCLR